MWPRKERGNFQDNGDGMKLTTGNNIQSLQSNALTKQLTPASANEIKMISYLVTRDDVDPSAGLVFVSLTCANLLGYTQQRPSQGFTRQHALPFGSRWKE
jgi:hypothetical protein